jgi:acetoin utilization protein AcuB
MLAHKVSGLPVIDQGKVVGIVTTSDILQAFVEVSGASTPGSIRVDLLRTGKEGDLTDASAIVAQAGGEVLSVGAYKDPWSEQPIFYLRVRGLESGAAASALEKQGYTVLSVH